MTNLIRRWSMVVLIAAGTVACGSSGGDGGPAAAGDGTPAVAGFAIQSASPADGATHPTWNDGSLTNPGSVTIIFDVTLDPATVVGASGPINVRLLRAGVEVETSIALTFAFQPNDTVILMPTNPAGNGQYTVELDAAIASADGVTFGVPTVVMFTIG